MTRRALLAAAALAAGSFTPAVAFAQSDPEPSVERREAARHDGGQRSFGVGPQAGWGKGVGAAAIFGFDPFQLWLTGGAMPILAVGTDTVTDQGSVTVYGAGQFGGDLAIFPWHSGRTMDFGLLAGYQYNTVIGSGGGGGVGMTLDLSRQLELLFSIEYEIFPDADAALHAHGIGPTTQLSLPWLQGGGNVGLVFFP